MLKKGIIIRDELGNPIDVAELKEFASSLELSTFKTLCSKNKREYEERLQVKEKEQQEKENALKCQLDTIESEIIKIKGYLMQILGVESEEEIVAVLNNEGEVENGTI